MKLRHLLCLMMILGLPTAIFAESTLTPAVPLETNPLAQQFTPHEQNTNTQLYVTQFTNPGPLESTNNTDSSASTISSFSAWVRSPSQLLSNQVLNRYGVGMQIGF